MGKYSELLVIIEQKVGVGGRMAVAFSGGVDSSLVAKAAVDAGADVLAITVDSPLFSRRDMEIASAVAEETGIRHVVVKSDYIPKNNIKRCYQCKKNMARLWKETAGNEGFHVVADGVTIDDINDIHRPGVGASTGENIWHPLADAGFTAEDVVNAAKEAGLSVWNRPSNSCLASRISYGEEITPKKLGMVEEAEEFLHDLPGAVRVRMHNDIARIEVVPGNFEKILERREEVVKTFRKIGFVHIVLDMDGYRSGSMNDGIMPFP